MQGDVGYYPGYTGGGPNF